ncbi:hypothetical protein B0H14DRAFT_3869559 [Mycena olivaceomarginata]|nr:hypothetical protein B0H14DRAFT_3869559 [Mycena olivaceomarginata]
MSDFIIVCAAGAKRRHILSPFTLCFRPPPHGLPFASGPPACSVALLAFRPLLAPGTATLAMRWHPSPQTILRINQLLGPGYLETLPQVLFIPPLDPPSSLALQFPWERRNRPLPLPYPSKGCWHAWAFLWAWSYHTGLSSGPNSSYSISTPIRPSQHQVCASSFLKMRAYPTRPPYPPSASSLLLPNPNPLFWNTPLPLLRARCPPPARLVTCRRAYNIRSMRTRWPSPVRSIVVTVTHAVNLRPCARSPRSPLPGPSMPVPCAADPPPVRQLLAAHVLNFCRSRAQFLPVSCSISTPCVLVARHYGLGRPHTRSSLMRASIVSPRILTLYHTHTFTADLKRHQAPVRMLRQRYPCSFSVSSPGGSGPNLIVTLAGMHNSLSKCFYPTDVSLRPNSPTTLSLAVGASYLL